MSAAAFMFSDPACEFVRKTTVEMLESGTDTDYICIFLDKALVYGIKYGEEDGNSSDEAGLLWSVKTRLEIAYGFLNDLRGYRGDPWQDIQDCIPILKGAVADDLGN